MHRINDKNGAEVMAQKVQTFFVDDLDGSEADGTVRFGVDGTEYEIDLNAKHAEQLRHALARYVAAGRRVSAGARRPARSGSKAQPSTLNPTAVREWARAQGIDVKDRGSCGRGGRPDRAGGRPWPGRRRSGGRGRPGWPGQAGSRR